MSNTNASAASSSASLPPPPNALYNTQEFMEALNSDAVFFPEAQFFVQRSPLLLIGRSLPPNMAMALFKQYPKGLPQKVAIDAVMACYVLSDDAYSGDTLTEELLLQKTVLPDFASTRIHLGSGLYHGGGMRTSIKGPGGEELHVGWDHRDQIITLEGPMTTREVADAISAAVVLEAYRNACLKRLALRALKKEGTAAEHFSKYIVAHGAPNPILSPGPFPDPTDGKPVHEIQHDFDEKHGGLMDGGRTHYKGLEPERDPSKGYDWKVKWSEPYCCARVSAFDGDEKAGRKKER